MPAFGDFGKGGTPVPHCPHHQQSLATCPCEYAREWRMKPIPIDKQDPPDDREDLLLIIHKLLDLLSQ